MQKRHQSSYPSYSDGTPFEGVGIGEVFRKIHDQRSWNYLSDESVSGEGSTLGQTASLSAALPALLRELGIKKLLDLPCGDFNWMQHVDLEGIHYTGADIVAALVDQHQAVFGNENRRFLQLNLVSDPLPPCDLIFCRDCLVHLSFADISAALQNIRRSGAIYFATTHFYDEPENKDIQTGGWRPLNFFLAPFLFPEPVAQINENCTEMDGAFADKCMSVWKIATI